MYIIASPPERLLTTGSSTSRGSSKRASFTLVMISASTSVEFSPRRTFASICEKPGSLCDVTNSTPFAAEMRRCSGVVTNPCTVSALAPGYEVLMKMTLRSTSGYCRSESCIPA